MTRMFPLFVLTAIALLAVAGCATNQNAASPATSTDQPVISTEGISTKALTAKQAKPAAELSPRRNDEVTLYRENFITQQGSTFRRPAKRIGWNADSRYHFEDYHCAEHGERGVDNHLPSVNSHPYQGKDAANGGCFVSNSQFPSLLYTTEYQKLTVGQIKGVRFQLSASKDARFWLALRVGEQWYVAEQPIVNTVGDTISANAFAEVGCRLDKLTWNKLQKEVVDGKPLIARIDGQVKLPDTGQVTGFGLFAGRHTYQHKFAIDEFEIRGVTK